MKFTKQFLINSLDDKGAEVETKQISTSRWENQFRRVFRHEGKLYETSYSVGATEEQEVNPYDCDDGEIECAEVVPQEKTITVYVRA